MPDEFDDQTFDPNAVSREDRESVLDHFGEDPEESGPEPAEETASEQSETPVESNESDTPESEEQEVSASEETDTSETASEEESEETPAEEPEEETKLLAGKYRTVEDLEAAYQNAQQMATRAAQEKSEYQRKLAEYERMSEQQQREQGPPEKPESMQTEEDTSEAEQKLFFDPEKYDEILYEKGEHAAQAYLFDAYNQAQQVEREQSEVQRVQSEVEQHNQELGQERARQLLYEYAKNLNDKNLMDKYGDSNFKVSAQDLESAPSVMNQIIAEYEFIEQNFKRQPVKVGNKELPGRYPKDVYEKAHKLLNHDKIVEQKVLETSENTAHAIKNAKPGARIGTPSGQQHSSVEVKWTGHESEDEAREKASKMRSEDVEDYLDNL